MEKKKCLIVDDSGVVRKISRKIVESLGFEAIEAENGKHALEITETTTPYLILLDWNMPVMNGLEFLKAYHEKQKQNNVKIIFVTTENDVVKIMTAIEAGANEYIMKPFDEEILKTKLTQMGLI